MIVSNVSFKFQTCNHPKQIVSFNIHDSLQNQSFQCELNILYDQILCITDPALKNISINIYL